MNIEQEAYELEQKARQLRMEASEAKRQKEREDLESFRKSTGLNVYESSDYAGLVVGKYKFYFGYEHEVCSKHGSIAHVDHQDCDEPSEWAFVAEVDNKEVLVLPQSKVHPEKGETMGFYLLAGIGHFPVLNN